LCRNSWRNAAGAYERPSISILTRSTPCSTHCKASTAALAGRDSDGLDRAARFVARDVERHFPSLRAKQGPASVKVAPGEWHSLTLRAEGNRFTVSFDGKQLIAHADPTFKTPGKVGLWTKADSVTRFESLTIKPLR
jgi:hypothetical protein